MAVVVHTHVAHIHMRMIVGAAAVVGAAVVAVTIFVVVVVRHDENDKHVGKGKVCRERTLMRALRERTMEVFRSTPAFAGPITLRKHLCKTPALQKAPSLRS